MSEKKRGCWPWSHMWSPWEILEQGKLGRVRSVADQIMVPGEIVVGTYETQRRACQNCGKSQLRAIRS